LDEDEILFPEMEVPSLERLKRHARRPASEEQRNNQSGDSLSHVKAHGGL